MSSLISIYPVELKTPATLETSEIVPTCPVSEEMERMAENHEEREPINVVFIGHVDSGKSTISGHILYLTGQLDKRTLEKNKQLAKEMAGESWGISFALDTLEEERAKGKTVEVGRACFETKTKRYTILDAPGHKNYIPNMIDGATEADVGVLVISARKGEFETGFNRGGQTMEHAMLAKSLGVSILIVIVNKMDDSTVNWDKERYDEIVNALSPFLRQVGYRKDDMFFMPMSGLCGINILTTDRVTIPWYDGPCFLDKMDSL